MQNHSSIVFVALGSNLDNPQQQILTAINAIRLHENIEIIQQSSLYKTVPYGYLNQDNFINAVIKIKTKLGCYELLTFLQSIERKQKRLKTVHWGPRTIDLDILCFGNLIINTEKLIIPHPDLKNRLFVLQPWAEIAADWLLPDGALVGNLWAQLQLQHSVA